MCVSNAVTVLRVSIFLVGILLITGYAFMSMAQEELAIDSLMEADISQYEKYLQDPEALQQARRIYRGGCGGYCHASYAASQSDAPFLFDCYWNNGGSPQEIFDVISNGVPETRMVAMSEKIKGGANTIWKIVAYLKKESQCK